MPYTSYQSFLPIVVACRMLMMWENKMHALHVHCIHGIHQFIVGSLFSFWVILIIRLSEGFPHLLWYTLSCLPALSRLYQVYLQWSYFMLSSLVIAFLVPWGSHLFLNLFVFQANTHINVHQDLKDVKLWQVRS